MKITVTLSTENSKDLIDRIIKAGALYAWEQSLESALDSEMEKYVDEMIERSNNAEGEEPVGLLNANNTK